MDEKIKNSYTSIEVLVEEMSKKIDLVLVQLDELTKLAKDEPIDEETNIDSEQEEFIKIFGEISSKCEEIAEYIKKE